MERYNTYSDHLKKKYGEKVYKIPISLPVTCPNRDGSLSSEPCIFCGSIGADYETKAVGLPITRQLDRSIAHVGPKYCLLYTSPSPRDRTRSRMPSSA